MAKTYPPDMVELAAQMSVLRAGRTGDRREGEQRRRAMWRLAHLVRYAVLETCSTLLDQSAAEEVVTDYLKNHGDPNE